jgi:hypothetical protein
MFRIGGPVNEGITSGLAPRQGYKDSGMVTDYEEKLRMLRGVTMPPDRSRSDFMIDWGLGMVSGTPRGNILSTAAEQAKEPFQRYKESQARRAEMGTKLGLSAATSAMSQSDKMKQIAAAAKYKNVDTALDDLTAYYLDEYKDYYVAKNRAKFDLNLRADIARTFGDSQVGGIIDQDALSTEALTKKWMKKNGGKINMVFYDINDGQIKKLVQQPGTGTLGFEVINPSILTGAAVDTSEQVQEQKVVSTGLSDAQAQTEAEKRGLILITRPEGAPRGWLGSEKRKNPNVITKEQLEEIIRQEEFSTATEHLKDKELR